MSRCAMRPTRLNRLVVPGGALATVTVLFFACTGATPSPGSASDSGAERADGAPNATSCTDFVRDAACGDAYLECGYGWSVECSTIRRECVGGHWTETNFCLPKSDASSSD